MSMRAAAEASAQSKAEGLKKDVIYAMHVIRYAGGKDLGAFGFGNAASSYYGKGNSLTGIDELDMFRKPNKHNYAQVADAKKPQKINKDDEHHANLNKMLEDAKTGFDIMIQACRDDFAAAAQIEKDESRNRMYQVNGDVIDLTEQATREVF